MNIQKQTLNQSSIAIEEAENRIRIIARNARLSNEPEYKTTEKVRKVINEYLKKIPIERLRKPFEKSLFDFYSRCKKDLLRLTNDDVLFVLAFASVRGEKIAGVNSMPTGQAKIVLNGAGIRVYGESTINLGNAAQKYMRTYMKQVEQTLRRISEETALDPDAKRRTSLRNRAEFETRAEVREQQRQSLLSQGVKLVIISSHADCSDRCRPYQGKVFSLDGTSGITTDGRQYEPIEKATDVYQVTQKGTVWKNGLFGFNCRHFMVAYQEGYKFPKITANIERREYSITQNQRAYERKVREWRAKAETYKGIEPEEYSNARKKAIAWNKQYIEYSQRNNRAYYPSRTKII